MKVLRSMPSELILDRYCTGNATEEEICLVKNWISENPEGEKILERRRVQAAEMFSRVPTFDELGKRVCERKQRYQKTRLISFITKPAVFIILITIGITTHFLTVYYKSKEWGTKGSNGGYCILKQGTVIKKVDSIAVAHNKDTLQIFHLSGKLPWIMVLYSENGGKYNNCISSDTAIRMNPGSVPVPVPFSIVIDSSKGLLECVLVASKDPFSLREAFKALHGKHSEKFKISVYRVMRE